MGNKYQKLFSCDIFQIVRITYFTHYIILFILLGNEKHNIQVASQQEDGEPTLQDMAVLIEQVTGVPVSFQKLIYKGNL